MSNLIKKIHYVWLGGGSMSPAIKHCIRSWKKYFPDWDVIQWNENNFDIDNFIFVKEALACKKYAFAADVIRLIVLKRYGGIYVDTDVEFLRNFECLLNKGFVSSLEIVEKRGWDILDKDVSVDGYLLSNGECVKGIGIQAGFLYSRPNHPFIAGLLREVYSDGNMHFFNRDGSFNQIVIDGAMIRYMNQRYGLKYRDTKQSLADEICIYDSSIFASLHTYERRLSCTIHWYEQSWNIENMTVKGRLLRKIKSNYPLLYKGIILFKIFLKWNKKFNVR